MIGEDNIKRFFDYINELAHNFDAMLLFCFACTIFLATTAMLLLRLF